MLSIKLTDRAKKDLRSIVLYTRKNFGSGQATLFVKELQAKIQILASPLSSVHYALSYAPI